MKKNIKDTIITFSSYNNDSQREPIRDEGKMSGVNVIRFVNEETVVCYAYRFHNDSYENKNILVFKMGSSEINVSIVNIDNSIFEIKWIIRDDNLGGNSFNEQLIKFCVDKFEE